MQAAEAIVECLKREQVRYLSCFPTSPVLEAAAPAGIVPIICRQERVGVGIADGYSRVSAGEAFGVFTMQFGPGVENAYAGIGTAFADASPILLLPGGHPRARAAVRPTVATNSANLRGITEHCERLENADEVAGAMRRAFTALRSPRRGPALLEVPIDVAQQTTDHCDYRPPRVPLAQGDPVDIERVADALLAARAPLIHAGQGVLYAHASEQLVALAELLDVPVVCTLTGKSAFPESHPLSLGTGAVAHSDPLVQCMDEADLVFGIGCSFSRHYMSMKIPAGKVMIQSTADPADLGYEYDLDHAILGDARLVLGQLLQACGERLKGKPRQRGTGERLAGLRQTWLTAWQDKLASDARPINPYRVVADLQRAIPAAEAIVTHESGSPRDQLTPFYVSAGPGSYLGWGKGHALGTSLGLIMGAKLARPDKTCINFMGDAAFGMVGTDFETAVRHQIPIITVVLKNSTMAVETESMKVSHSHYRTRDLGGDYADMALAMGGQAERVSDPAQIIPAFQRARRINQEQGQPVLLEFITSAETAVPNRAHYGLV